MKKLFFTIIALILTSNTILSQLIVDNNISVSSETMKQIQTPGLDNILFFQTLNQGTSNFASIQQIGNSNKTTVNQQILASSKANNLSYTVQSGTSNELSIGQVGSGNLLLGFQLGYIASSDNKTNGNHYGNGLDNGNGNANAFGHEKNDGTITVEGIGNKLNITQNGNNNSLMAVQQGTTNEATAEQNGNNNYLLTYQKGSNNKITNFKQENESEKPLTDKIIQIGENLLFSTENSSKTKANGYEITQTGTNLSLQLNSELPNTNSGIEINQKGNDMKVKVEQSYFTFPMK